MVKIKIESTLQNKARQKKLIHQSSSTVFLAVCSHDGSVDTEVSLLNHFILKRGIEDVVATVEFRGLKGDLVNTFKINMDEPRVYSIYASEHISGSFLGSIYIYFNSNENLAVPFCAVMCSIKTKNSVCGVHTYGRRLEQKELGGFFDLQNTIETGWTARDTNKVKSFAVLHGGNLSLTLNLKLEILNSSNKKLFISHKYKLEPFGTLIIVPQDLSNEVIRHLGNEKGHIKVHIDGINGIFPRMLCGNFLASFQTNQMPHLWFTEGLAEYWSTEWDTQAEMVLRDAVLNNNLIPLEYLYLLRGFLMYKEGQKFLEFVSDEYGEEKILLILENIWRFKDFYKVIEFTLGESIERISAKWTHKLKQEYYPLK